MIRDDSNPTEDPLVSSTDVVNLPPESNANEDLHDTGATVLLNNIELSHEDGPHVTTISDETVPTNPNINQ